MKMHHSLSGAVRRGPADRTPTLVPQVTTNYRRKRWFESCVLILLWTVIIPQVDSIQCYSCKATASNEIEANIRCLETANLEDCNDFYNYYSEVEDLSVPSLDYVDSADYSDTILSSGNEKQTNRKSERGGEKSSKMTSSSGRRIKRDSTTTKSLKKKHSELEYDYKSIEDYQYLEQTKKKRNSTLRTPSGEVKTTFASSSGGSTNSSSDGGSSLKGASLPTDREHYCYSMTRKNAWESYTIEKGCKKIVYCKTHEENLPDWTMPWNFCCDKSRCNAKLVKDKPQRIFAMGCRRTDDCIQGHNSRHVCPEMFQACPKVSTNVVKMECRAKTKPAISSKHNVGGSYFGQFKEKKCFCAKGFYPRGPICTSHGIFHRLSWLTLCFSVSMLVFPSVIF